MDLNFQFFLTSILLGFGLAMDAFSVSVANGLNEPKMKFPKMFGIAGIFAFFQFLMPMAGWLAVTFVSNIFSFFEKFIPWIALGLLAFIGIKMIVDCVKGEGDEECPCKKATFGMLMVQGIATSIDALSVGFTIAEYQFEEAFLASFLIALVTFFICLIGIEIGKKVGTKLAGKAGILGGAILIIIGLEIFISSFF